MGDKVNVLIDNFKSVLTRFIELPIFIWILGILFGVFIIWLVLRRLFRKNWSTATGLGILTLLISISSLLIIGIVIDKKFGRTATSMELLDFKLFNIQNEQGRLKLQLNNTLDSASIVTRDRFLNLDSFKKDWQKNYLVSELTLNDAADVYFMRIFEPLASTFLAVVDLTNSKLEIVLSPEIKDLKTLTSDFAWEHDCFLAINGEAGNSPWQGSGFGPWVGNYISAGNALMLQDNEIRPFLSFDKDNNPTYFKASIVDTTVTEEKYNTIFGRYDILVAGEVVQVEDDISYPRTIMGINEAEDKLYLLVVDGSQPEYSLGLTYQYCAKLLKHLGAWNVMACDQGGSSCMYVKDLGGIISRPVYVEEREVYTHFGLRIKGK